MNKLQMNSAWHIQNLIESEPDCQVVTLHDANLYVDKLEARISELSQYNVDLATESELKSKSIAELEMAVSEISALLRWL